MGPRIKRVRTGRGVTLADPSETTGISKSRLLPLTRQPDGVQAWKIVIPARQPAPQPRTRDGYEWLYVLSGRMRLILGDRDLVLDVGEAAEFGSTGEGPAEVLSIFGRPGERMHVRARSRGQEPAG